LHLMVMSIIFISCSHIDDLELHKKPPITEPIVKIEMNGFYYCKGIHFDALMILFEDGKAYFHPYLRTQEPDSSLKYILENINSAIGGTTDFWGNFNVVKNKLYIEYVDEDNPSMIYNIIDVSGNVIDSNTITISTIECNRFKNKPCEKIGFRAFNPSLTFVFHAREFYIQKAKFYDEKWYMKEDWYYNANN